MSNRKKSICKWIFIILAGLILAPLPAIAEENTLPATATPTTITAPLDGSGNQYRKGQGGEGYTTMSAEDLGLRRRAGNQQGDSNQNGDRNHQRLRDQSGSGSQAQHRYNGTGSLNGSGNYGGSGGGGHHGQGGRRR